MKKIPIQWILLVLTVVVIAAVGISCVSAMVKFQNTGDRLDSAQLTVLTTKEEIEELQQQRENEQKEARQEALNEQLEENAKKTQEASEAAESEADGQADVEEAEENLAEEEDSFSKSNGHIIGIDPGHQGSWVDMSALEPNAPGSSEMKARCTTGTTGNYTGLEEYQLNLNVSLVLRDILVARGYQVVMTREDNDANISNAERAHKVAEAGAEIYVRVHANSSDDASVSGALTMCQSSSNPYVGDLYEESYRLSELILNSYCEATGIGNRGIMITDTMTGINWSSMPVTIVEMGFMSNQGDDTKMADSTFWPTMAEGIANGIDAYFAEE